MYFVRGSYLLRFREGLPHPRRSLCACQLGFLTWLTLGAQNRYGLPQLVLPVWFDTYEYAERAKYLGIGLIGNTGVAPRVEGAQFGNKLLQVLQDEALHARAKAVGEACSKREGREVAAAEVKKWALAAEPTQKPE